MSPSWYAMVGCPMTGVDEDGFPLFRMRLDYENDGVLYECLRHPEPEDGCEYCTKEATG